ncbi:MAG TPA: sugar phosphate isomerase/epimerase [Thermoguttaceae bacterium]
MQKTIYRRHFLITSGAIGLGIGMIGKGTGNLLGGEAPAGAPNAEKLGWRLGCQAWTFNRFTFFEAIDKVASLGLKYIEAFPNQKLSKDREEMFVNELLPADARKDIKTKLNDCGIKLVNYGVCKLSEKKDDSRRVFDFAKDMGIETLVSEPPEEILEMLDNLCGEYGINIAIHNHPEPTHYWNPDTVLKACQGRSKHIGACADTGHWVRSDLNPVDSLKKLQGRVICLHFKDLNQQGKEAHDVPWGTGVCDVKAMLLEIHRHAIRPVFSVEYEYNWDNSLPEVAQCVAYFDKVAAEIGAKS